MPSTRSHLKRARPEEFLSKPVKSRRGTSGIEKAAQLAGERAGQIKSGTELRCATEADLKADSLQETQHLLLKMAKTFFLARSVLSEDGTRREFKLIPCSGIEAQVTFCFLFYEPRNDMLPPDMLLALSAPGMTKTIHLAWAITVWLRGARC